MFPKFTSRMILILAHDLLAAVAAVLAAFYIRFEARGLAERWDLLLLLLPEAGLRNQARRMRDGLAARHPDSEVVFASKSFPCLAVYKLFAAEGLSIDVAGAGELVMALAAGVRPDRMYLHGNAKTTAELTMALEAGLATVVVDNFDDIDRLEQIATRPQRVLIRIIPGVAPDTHESQSTGGDDSKFGLPLDQAREAITRIKTQQQPEASTASTCTSGRRSWTPSRSRGRSRRCRCWARSTSTMSAAASVSAIPWLTRHPPSRSTSTRLPPPPRPTCPPGRNC